MNFKNIAKAKADRDEKVDSVQDPAEAQRLTMELFAEVAGVK